MKYGEINYIRSTPKFKECPRGFTGEAAQAWRALAAGDGVTTAESFDDDWSPIGPRLRELFMQHGAAQSTSGKTTIIFLPEV